MLSSEAFASVEGGFRGFINLGILLLFLTHVRMVVANLLKYRLYFLEVTQSFTIDWYKWPALIIILTVSISTLFGLLIERALFSRRISPTFGLLLQVIYVGILIILPDIGVIYYCPAMGSGVVALIWSTIIWMKMVSYFHVNANARHIWKINHAKRKASSSSSSSYSRKEQEEGTTVRQTEVERNKKSIVVSPDFVQYPKNLSVKHLFRFLVIPSLVYEINFPRTPRVRWGFLLRRVAEAIFLSMIIYFMAVQYILPILQKTITPIEQLDIAVLVERLLKLAIPNLYLWLLGFYVGFHLYLNIWAELTGYADRLFYLDWWNSTTLGYFWRTWNLPVHNWMLQNIYIPLLNRGYSKSKAGFACFFVSAVFHEVLISVPFGTLKMWAFMAIIVQMPLIEVTNKFLKGTTRGNVIFWLNLVIGQPLCIAGYYYYYRTGYASN